MLTRYPWDQQYPLGSIGTQAQVVGVAGGGSDASMYSVNCRCNFVIRVVSARSSALSVALVVDKVPNFWRPAVIAVARFASPWAWVCSICSRTDAFYCLVAAQMWD